MTRASAPGEVEEKSTVWIRLDSSGGEVDSTRLFWNLSVLITAKDSLDALQYLFLQHFLDYASYTLKRNVFRFSNASLCDSPVTKSAAARETLKYWSQNHKSIKYQPQTVRTQSHPSSHAGSVSGSCFSSFMHLFTHSLVHSCIQHPSAFILNQMWSWIVEWKIEQHSLSLHILEGDG